MISAAALGVSLTFVSWTGLEPDGASPEVPAGSSRVGSSLQGHEGICLRNGSQSFPMMVPVPLSKGIPCIWKDCSGSGTAAKILRQAAEVPVAVMVMKEQ